MKKIISLAIFIFPVLLSAQEKKVGYADRIARHREEYKADFLKNQRSPLREKDLPYLRFYEPDEKYRVVCTFELTPDEKPFELSTYSGQTIPYRKYGVLTFELDGKKQKLPVYQSLRLLDHPLYKEYLFLPFRDPTNGADTYGGGRYIDLKLSQVQQDTIILDFNKAYNPWCAYSDGYSCPAPPPENHLDVPILAGEKMYAKKK